MNIATIGVFIPIYDSQILLIHAIQEESYVNNDEFLTKIQLRLKLTHGNETVSVGDRHPPESHLNPASFLFLMTMTDSAKTIQ